MLFHQIYNWIKYKTLPSSFLFKNRLFIERDSKLRRITNNFGLVFRNSKWSNYELYNLKHKFLHQFNSIKNFIFTFIFCICFFLFFKFYSTSSVFNQFYFIIWFSLDFIDYYFTFFLWLSFIFFTTFFNSVYSYFFVTHVMAKKKNFNLILEQKMYTFKLKPVFTNHLSKKDYKLFVFQWLNKDSFSHSFFNLSSLFNAHEPIYFSQHLNYFYNLFKLTNYFNLIETSYFKFNNLNNLSFSLIIDNNFISFFYLYFKNFQFSKLFNHPILFHSYSFLNNNWELSTFNNTSVLNKKNNIFSFIYLFNFNFKNLNFYNYKFNEFNLINKNFLLTLNNSKSLRWLYRYSIIHRKTFKNSHKLTLIKKLIHSDFLNKNLTHKNIWNSEILSKLKKINSFHLMSNLNSPFFFSSQNKTFNFNLNNYTNNYKEELKNLSFLENSFFWILKRFDIFNNLKNNKISLSFNPIQNNSKNFNNFCLNSYLQTLNFFFNSFYLFNNNFFLNSFSLPYLFFSSNLEQRDLLLNEKINDLLDINDLEYLNLLLNTNTSFHKSFFTINYFFYFSPYSYMLTKTKFKTTTIFKNFFYISNSHSLNVIDLMCFNSLKTL